MPTTMPSWFQLAPSAEFALGSLVLNLIIDAALASALAWYYVRYGRTLSNRRVLARMLPLLSLTTVFIISIVKSSLALSLGLVGALSIVRFRTPIKEPEELAYLFMAIALGLGLGADQRLPTILAFLVIIVILRIWSLRSGREKNQNLYLNIEVEVHRVEGASLDTVVRLVEARFDVADLRRLDVRDDILYATFCIDGRDDHALARAMDALRQDLPGAAISFVGQDVMLEA